MNIDTKWCVILGGDQIPAGIFLSGYSDLSGDPVWNFNERTAHRFETELQAWAEAEKWAGRLNIECSVRRIVNGAVTRNGDCVGNPRRTFIRR